MTVWPDKTVQGLGDFTTSGAITMQGSNDGGTTWTTLTNNLGVDLVFTAAGIGVVLQNPGLIRPNATAGTSVAMDVYVIGVR